MTLRGDFDLPIVRFELLARSFYRNHLERIPKSRAFVAGFRHRMRKTVQRIQPRDIRVCDLTGVMRWVGTWEVLGQSEDKTRIWKDDEFPAQLKAKPRVTLSPANGIALAGIRKLNLAPSLKPAFPGNAAEFFSAGNTD